MYNSGISAKILIDELRSDVDITLPISDEIYILWLNALEYLLYTEVIQEQKAVSANGSLIVLADLEIAEDESPVRFEDVYTVYAGDTQLIKSTVASGVIFQNTYYKSGADMALNLENADAVLKIVYFVKPALKTVDDGGNAKDSEYVRVPIEFIELVKAKLRAEAYKVANEDEIAAKWLNDYNVLLETFKAWIGSKAPQFGM